VASDCSGIPTPSCAVWACVAAKCVPGCFDGGSVADSGHDSDSGVHEDAGNSIPDAGFVCGDVKTATTGDLLLNEFLAAPPMGIQGDANRDNVTSSTEDEFVEIANVSSNKLQLLGVTISDGLNLRHVFESYELDCGKVIVVFGGGITAMWPANWITASEGRLSLNNGGDTISINSSTAASSAIETYEYGTEANRGESLTRSPDLLKDGLFVPHTSLPPNKLYSPGTKADGNPF